MEEVDLKLIACPWCQSVTEIPDDTEEILCSICHRIITEEDIEDAEVKNKE